MVGGGERHAACPGGRGAETGPAPGASVSARPSPPPEPSHFLCRSGGCQGAGRAARSAGSGRPRGGCRSGSPPRRPAAPHLAPAATAAARHGPAQGPPGGLDAQPVARYVPLASACRWEPLGGSELGCWGDAGPPRSGGSLAAKLRKRGRRGDSGPGVWVCGEELGKIEKARVEERGGLAAPPDTLATSRRPAGETRASRERGGRVARAGRGPDARSKRRLGSPPACGGRRLKFGEPGAAARESWGDLGAERCPESLRPRSDEAPGQRPLGGGERSPAGPKATGAASQSRAPETLPDTRGRDGATGARNYAVIQ